MNWISLNSMIRKWFRRKPLNVLEGGTGANTSEKACENLGAVKKTGDIISGDLQIYDNTNLKETMRLKSDGNLVFYKESGNSSLESYAIQFKDKAGDEDYYGHIDIIASAPESEKNKRVIRLTSHSKNVPENWQSKAFNALELGVDDTGTRTVNVSAPKEWREAIGAVAASHNHSASNITSGTLSVARGGTGRTTTASGAMYATSSGGAIKMGTLPIAQGGTGKTTAADARSALGAAAKGWTQLASSTGTTSTKINITNYSEVMVVARYSTSYLSSVVLSKIFLIATPREVYLGGGWYTGGDRRCCVRISSTSFTGLQCIVDGSVVTSSTNFYLYAR